MKALVEHNPALDRVQIWVYQPRMNGGSDFLGSDLMTMTFVEGGGVMPPPTIEVPHRVAGALASALASFGGPEEATRGHLRDAITVRDRLLTLLERGAA